MNSSLAAISRSFRALCETEQEFVLATIIETSGSTYRKTGARMLISRDGQFYGLLGGGCFETDLLEHVYKVFGNRQASTVYYDMRAPEDLVWGLGLGCNGAVRIRLEYLCADNGFAPMAQIETALTNGQRCLLISVCESAHKTILPGQHYLYPAPDNLQGNDHLPQELSDIAGAILESGQSILQTVVIDKQPVEVFMAIVEPPLHLAVIGGGPDAVPVTEAARLLGWKVSVIDYRESCTHPDNFPAADAIINATPEQLPERLNLATIDAAVLMTHKFEYDLRYLKVLTLPSLRYIGLLGPAARRNELLKSLDQGLLQHLKTRIYGPVGLDIGGELPEEIAFSLIAEIQSVFKQRDGRHLTDKSSAGSTPESAGKLATIILAAGGSTRFGALKQLLEYNGTSLLKRSVETAMQLPDKQILVVHGPKHTKCQRELSGLDVTHLVNHEWETGMSSSLKLAIEAVPAECEGALILLCDQPLIRTEHLQKLTGLWQENPDKIIASEYAGTCGVPAIIPKHCFTRIKTLGGDSGAKQLFTEFSDIL
ncbi:MAG: NTP transferase domain-containing protein, partial [Gammaproteobacteria bacterium]